MDLEAQVKAGQAALGKLMRQFLAVNEFKHVQFMTMAHAVTGVRWLHSSQISNLKQGGTRNLSGFPLFSVAMINRRIHDINAGLAPIPPGTPRADWEGKRAMTHPDGQPLDVGDLWRIYFGELEPPLFSDLELPELDEGGARRLSQALHDRYLEHCQQSGVEPMSYLPAALGLLEAEEEERKLIKGVLLGVLEFDAEQANSLLPALAAWLSQLQGKAISVRQLQELAQPG